MRNTDLRLPLIALLLAGTAASPALAVDAQPETASVAGTGSASPTTPGQEAEEEEQIVAPRGGEIVVVATRIKGQVDAPQAPIQVLTEEDIASYGSASLSDLIDQLSPQTGSGRGRGSGRPVILLNGQRISNFREMRNIPPEAIRRLEILPEEVALRYGYPADQRVINFILKDNFAAKTVEVEYEQPDRGGTSTLEGEASLFRTAGQGRLNLTVTSTDTTPLFESERGVVQANGNTAAATARTLVADSRSIGTNATWTTGLGEKGLAGSLTLNGAFTRADTTSFSGLDTVTFDPLARAQRTETSEAGITYARPLGDWQLTATFDGSHAVTNTRIDQNGLSGVDRAHSVNDSLTSLLTVVGRPINLPAGEVTATFKTGFAYTGIDSADTRNVLGDANLKRGDASVGVNIGVPIASRRNDVLAGLGNLNLNFSAGYDRLSDYGSLTDWSGGVTWGLTEKLNLQASYIYNQAAPALTDLGNPLVQSYNVAVYDFLAPLGTPNNVLVTVLTGGNPNLAKQTQKDIKLGANWQLPFMSNSNVLVEYFHNDSDNVTAAFPVLTPEIEAAFPGRVVRDANGVIVSIDRRPVTFANETSSRIRYGFNIGGQFGTASAAAANGRGGAMGGMMGGGGPPPGGGGMGGPPGGGGGRGGGGGGGGPPNGRGRWNISLYHTMQFYDRVTIAAGGPVLDLLNGDALTSGGVSRHSLEFEGGGFYRGIGLRFNGKWTAPTTVRSTGASGTSALRFGALTKVNFRLFADLGQQASLVKDHPFFKGTRLTLKIDNILGQRQRVTDGTGGVPTSYQPDLLDPLGRVIGIELRKQF